MSFFRPKSEIIDAYDASLQHIKSISGLSKRLNDRLWSIRSLSHLIPYPIESLFSGHNFPLIEAQQDIDDSYALALSGFYKSAISSLRNVLELGLLSVYWDRNDEASTEIKNWLKSKERTPQLRVILDELLKVKGFPEYTQYEDLRNRISSLHEGLSKFSHTRGLKNSSYYLRRGNVHAFHKEAFDNWYGLFDQVCQAVCIVHLLKYPLGLQYTPVDDKYGVNGPIGYFLQPHESEQIKSLLRLEDLTVLQRISNSDETAVSIAHSINEMDDISQEELESQLDEEDKHSIGRQGFLSWLKEQRSIYAILPEGEEYVAKKAARLKPWAVETGFYNEN